MARERGSERAEMDRWVERRSVELTPYLLCLFLPLPPYHISTLPSVRLNSFPFSGPPLFYFVDTIITTFSLIILFTECAQTAVSAKFVVCVCVCVCVFVCVYVCLAGTPIKKLQQKKHGVCVCVVHNMPG